MYYISRLISSEGILEPFLSPVEKVTNGGEWVTAAFLCRAPYCSAIAQSSFLAVFCPQAPSLSCDAILTIIKRLSES